MSTLELLQLQNEHKDNNFYGKGEDATEEQEGETSYDKWWETKYNKKYNLYDKQSSSLNRRRSKDCNKSTWGNSNDLSFLCQK